MGKSNKVCPVCGKKELRIAMLSAVLRSDDAIQVSDNSHYGD